MPGARAARGAASAGFARIAAMRILVSNDDGYFSPGIEALVRAISGLGDVMVVAPERDRSGASNSLTLDRPLSGRTAANDLAHVASPTDSITISTPANWCWKLPNRPWCGTSMMRGAC